MANKKVLVTGSSGFMGSHLVDTLEERGYEVILFDKSPSIFRTPSQKEFVGDLLDNEQVESALRGCEVVYHFAAQADIDQSIDAPVETLKTNIVGTQNLLELSRKHKVKRFIFASTVYVYSDLGGFYRVSKQACEKIIEEYQRAFGLNYTILRFGSLYGPRANKFNAINNFIIQAIKNKKIIRKSDGEELREYIHVKDAARLSLDALSDKYKNKHLIISGNQQIKIKDLLTMIQEIFNGEVKIEFSSKGQPHHYEISPYNYKPQIAQKIVSDTFYDLGQGILDLIYDIEKSINQN